MRGVGVVLFSLAVGVSFASEPPRGCFGSPAEAALMRSGGEVASGGFRVEAVRRDPLRRQSWATVRNCAHPERPAIVVAMLREAGAAAAGASVERARQEPVAVAAGASVRVVSVEANVRLEMAAVAQASAAVGERVRVRVVREAGEPERVLEGVVRGEGLVELGGVR